MCLSLLLVTACQAQTEKSKKSVQAHTVLQPKVNWNVSKQYDNKGNLIGYDSTYTWMYSGQSGKDIETNMDSLMFTFRRHFNKDFAALFNDKIGESPWNDSLFYNGFFKPDYLMKTYNENSFIIENMVRSIDSMRNSFLNKDYPELRRKKY